ncbi:hypothetical protein N7509_001335 [Penicillium cosmopolitanum]|uniref:Uncharacterized protein n=1 Tax=Penicillium cosmopolitanum TaxID=1131564 RepID=A0A9X0BF26_9EURO|nr:uncharacterized protein N7509_001335 [Penicillium cosmopolitanum]KAJ5414708.1 hypothetical protein N7509_001335 [Penicillium cosmopolitanum]
MASSGSQHFLADPFVTPTGNPHPSIQREVPTLFGAAEKTTEARIRVLEAQVLTLQAENVALQRRIRVQEEITNAQSASPVHRDPSQPRRDAQERVHARMNRRDALVDAQVGQLAFHVAHIVQGLNNLAHFVANFVCGLPGPAADSA